MKTTFTLLSCLLLGSGFCQTPLNNWAFNSQNSTSTDCGSCITSDASGNTYVAGQFYGTIDLDPGAGVQAHTATNTPCLFVVKYDPAGNHVWSGAILGNDWMEVNAICLDPSGNVCIAGNFNGTADFDPGPGVYQNVALNIPDGYIAMYDVNGAHLRSWTVSGTGHSFEAIDIDTAGNIYATGWFRGSADFDPGSGVQLLVNSGGGSNAFVAKYSNLGAYLFAFLIGTATEEAEGSEIHLNGTGSVLVAGKFRNTIDFDPSAGVQNMTAVGYRDVFLAQYDATGAYQLSFHFGGGNTFHECTSVETNASGDIVMLGHFSGSVDFDPGPGSVVLTTNGVSDIFFATYTAAGALQWTKNVGGTTNDQVLDGELDTAGNIYITGRFANTVDFDPDAPVKNVIAAGTNLYDIFVASYSPAGIYRWAFAIGDTSDMDYGYGITVSGAAVYITGGFGGTADFDPNAGVNNLVYNGGKYDLYVGKYSNDEENGIRPYVDDSYMIVWPNPAGELLFAETTAPAETAYLEMINACGQVVLRVAVTSAQTSIDVSALPEGMYICNLFDENGIAARRKLLIAR